MAYLDDEVLCKELTREYSRKLNTEDLRNKWVVAKGKYPEIAGLSYSVKHLLVSPFATLVVIARKYRKVMELIGDTDKRKEIHDYLKSKVFKYKGLRHDKLIAPFFMEHADDLQLHTCHYCDSTFINVFTYEDEKSGNKSNKAHFDLDHVISQDECPLLALSLFNFVPSCNMCNSRIKGKKVLAELDELLRKFSPTSRDYNIDRVVDIVLTPQGEEQKVPFMDNRDYYKIEFDCHRDLDYQSYVKTFLLEERYNYHKVEALRLKDLLLCYPPANLRNISNVLNKPYEEVKEDIFGERFVVDEHRCFKKLKRDMLK